MNRIGLWALLFFVFASCGDDTSSESDAAAVDPDSSASDADARQTEVDGGADGGAVRDASPERDAQPIDANAFDAGAPTDASFLDSGPAVDSGSIDASELDACAASTYYEDTDEDGFGDPGSSTTECAMPAGFVANADDCNDSCADCYPGASEMCDDTLDNDCDGDFDEPDCDECVTGSVRSCGATDEGVCDFGTQTCDATGQWQACVGEVTSDVESCNGDDDDCDGTTDEGSLCSFANAASSCTSGACVVDSCTTGYANCDSQVETGCEVVLATNADHCGMCGNDCGLYGCAYGRCDDERWSSHAGGFRHACARTAGGTLYCWGANNEGQLGLGTTTDASSPVRVTAITSSVSAVGAGSYHSCAIAAGVGIQCWGSNTLGQLGDGTTTTRTTPTTLALGLGMPMQVASKGSTTCARLQSGSAYCWGRNAWGQIGDGTVNNKLTPTYVDGTTDVTTIAVGDEFVCATRQNGQVLCWGQNTQGQLGDGTNSTRTTAVTVSGITNALEVATANNTACARTSSNVMCWGQNDVNQLGGATTAASTSVPVTVLNQAATRITAGYNHFCAALSSGSVVCWGINEYGELGDGTRSVRSMPVTANVSSAATPSAGYSFSCAGTANGTLSCWGANDYGQIGVGTIGTAVTTPSTVSVP